MNLLIYQKFLFVTKPRGLGPKREPPHTREDSPHKRDEGLHKWKMSPHKHKKSSHKWEEVAYPMFEP